jgi:hypothetical protein
MTADEGKFALSTGDELLDVYGNNEDALNEGRHKSLTCSPFLRYHRS